MTSYIVYEWKPRDIKREFLGIYKRGYLYAPVLIGKEDYTFLYTIDNHRKKIPFEELKKNYTIREWDGELPVRVLGDIILDFEA